ncbi:hypothetical protein PF002_g25396 [Phytophthora fragariae]|uniref:Uncharacterized protein n=1 Tax=Phytophthora fragariae TaxID=53985 RepID=A0A6A4BXG0_9STRA|nr:hypothetical protein PF003_g3578 [Phytophthora fragariae]KAE8924705.1 hypothetical protein PF009_g25064 [Phytophthora fragariae]KAE9053225.1 hypothetical protein PF007_g33013 [Phytophthora fragariae]KAE9096954.1 hypothetical protein PF006_g23686 [Phytophthora fragariae]KAE9186884.1 hypothetical protein PF004_g22956 [Phytophthora fragariae]
MSAPRLRGVPRRDAAVIRPLEVVGCALSSLGSSASVAELCPARFSARRPLASTSLTA